MCWGFSFVIGMYLCLESDQCLSKGKITCPDSDFPCSGSKQEQKADQSINTSHPGLRIRILQDLRVTLGRGVDNSHSSGVSHGSKPCKKEKKNLGKKKGGS